ncbi:unnamed protein product [Triticum turgidum subsp. durum]|uniref:Uncharacterized protein n=1 Tax=Triticum turgidum subsp. durum TaxID=4567 RepID=A0A9R1R153_TRITD|nr:unnamed protein product [Triticum turgidum subsp. durum]
MESSGLRKRVADMMDGGKYKPKGYGMAAAGQRLPCALLLLLVLAGAALSVVVMHKVREQRAFAVVLKERDVQAVSLRIQLQKEKAYGKETKRKAEEMKATMSSLRTQKTDLKTKLKALEATATILKNVQKELEASLKERESRISQMEGKAANLHSTRKALEATLKERDNRIKQMQDKVTSAEKTLKEQELSLKARDSRISQLEEKTAAASNPDQMAALMEILQRKEAELEEIKTRFQDYRTTDRKVVSSSHNKKSELARRNKKVLTDSHAENQKSGHPLDQQDSHHVRYNKLLENENIKTDETKKKNSTVGHLEKISKDSLSDVNLDRPRQRMTGAADVKPKVPVNDDLQQNKKQKNKKPKSKKKVVDTSTW